MQNDLIDEQLLRDAAELPEVSPRLRRNVLHAAKKAESRRRVRRRISLAASVLLPLVALSAWFHGTVNDGPSNLAAEGTDRVDGSTMQQPTAVDAWEGVDESLRKRKAQSKTIPSGLY